MAGDGRGSWPGSGPGLGRSWGWFWEGWSPGARAESQGSVAGCDSNDEQFTTFIVQFEKENYKTSWNYNALQFALCHALPQCIKDILHLAPKQPSYDGYKALVTQINQRYWEDCSEYSIPCAPWNSSGNFNWQTRATAGNQTTGAALPPNLAARLPLGQGLAKVNRPPEPRPQMQLNAANMQEAPDPNPADPDSSTDPHNTPDYANNKEALCTSRFRNQPWIDISEKMQENDATDNFINESLTTLATTPQKILLPIHLTLFDGSSTSTGDIIHYIQTTLTFANSQWQDLQLLVTHLHTSTPLILGLL
ncbi:hypothetical protein C0993_009268 [Termitomyces sp. T159_Od127]|nr:hypothetical protein C0993_009268 [Termitomyces sp. T159_Od127]